MPDPFPGPSRKNSTPVPNAKPVSGDTVNPSSDSVGGTRTEGADYSAEAVKRLDMPAQLGGYRILSILGEGGMGRVYLAEDSKLNRKVALKVMRADLAAKPEAVERFLREARAVAAIEHDHVIGIFQVGEENGVPFLAMPLLKGETLDARLKRDRVIPVSEAVRLARETAEGLATAHEAGLIHRDIKPANLWLDASPGRKSGEVRVKILDFGLAHTVGASLTASGTVMGTPAFMAPEQARGHKVDHRCDLFSLGAVIYQMLTGKRPFTGEDAMAIVSSLALDTPTAPHRLNGAVPPALSHLVMRLIAKDPAQRPQSTRGVAAELLEVEREFTAPPVAMAVPVVIPPMPQPESNPWSDIDDDVTEQIAPAQSAPASVSRTPEVASSAKRNQSGLVVLWGVLGIAVLGGAIFLFTKSRCEREAPTQPEIVDKVEPPKERIDPEKRRLEDSEAAFPALEKKFKEPTTTFESFARELAAFNAKWPGTPASIRAAGMLRELPSPFDVLDPANIPADARAAWKVRGFDGKDVVAVLGEHRGRSAQRSPISAISFSVDGKRIFTGDTTGAIQVWDAGTLVPEAIFDRLKGSESVRSLAVHPDGKRLLVGDWGTPAVWDIGTGKPLHDISGQTSVFAVAISTDGKKALIGRTLGQMLVWDFEQAKIVRTIQCGTDKNGVASVAFSKDGSLAAAGLDDGRLQVWRLDKGERLAEVNGHKANTRAVLFNPNGKCIATAGEGHRVKIWETDTWKQLAEWSPSGHDPNCIAYSPDGAWLACGTYAGTLDVFDTATGKHRAKQVCASPGIHAVAFSADGKTIVTGDRNGFVVLWNTETLTEVIPVNGSKPNPGGIVISPDMRYAATGHGTGQLRLLNLAGMNQLLELPWQLDFRFQAAAFSPDGKHLSYTTKAELVETVEVKDGKSVRTFLNNNANNIIKVTYSPDGKKLACGLYENAALVWDTSTGKLLHKLPEPNHVYQVRFSPDGKLLVTGSFQVATLWETAMGAKRATTSGDTVNGSCMGLDFSDDSSRLYAAGGMDKAAKILRVGATDLPLEATFPDGGAAIRSTSVAPGGGLIAVASEDRYLAVRRIPGGDKLREWILPYPIRDISFAPDGRHITVSNLNGTVYILRLPAEIVGGGQPAEVIKRIADAEAALPDLEAKGKAPTATFASFAADVREFQIKWGGTPAGVKAAELLTRLRSPLDALDPALIPEDAKAEWKALGYDGKDVVAVFGESRGRHWGRVHGAYFSENGQNVISVGADSTLRLWDATARNLRRIVKMPGGGVLALAISSDRRILASSHEGVGLRFWDLETFKEIQRIESLPERCKRLVFLSDNRHVLAAHDDGVARLYDRQSGKLVRSLTGHEGRQIIDRLIVSPDDRWAVTSARDGTTRFWDLAKGIEVHKLTGDWLHSCYFSNDSRRASICNGSTQVLDVGSWKAIQTVQGRGALTPDGKRLFASTDTEVQLLDVQTGNVLHRRNTDAGENRSGRVIQSRQEYLSIGDKGAVFSSLDTGQETLRLAFAVAHPHDVTVSPDGNVLVIWDQDRTLRVFDLKSRTEQHPPKGPRGFTGSASFSPDSSTLLTTHSDRIGRTWSLNQGVEPKAFQCATVGRLFSGWFPDGKRFWVGGEKLDIREAETTKVVAEIKTPDLPASAAVSPDGRTLLVGQHFAAELWDVSKLPPVRLHAMPDVQSLTVAYGLDGKQIATGGNDHRCRMWDISTLAPKLVAQLGGSVETGDGNVYGVRWLADGKTIAVNRGGHMQFWTVTPRGARLVTHAVESRHYLFIAAAHPSRPWVAWVPEFAPSTVVLAGADGKTIREWQLPGPVHALAFAADGRHLATSNGNGTVYILRQPGVESATGKN